MRPRMLTQTIVIGNHAVDVLDDYGNPTRGAPTYTTFRGYAWIASANEKTVGGLNGVGDRNFVADLQVQEWKLVLEAAAEDVVTSDSTATFDGLTFEIIGTPWVARNPRTGEVSHIQTSMRRSEG